MPSVDAKTLGFPGLNIPQERFFMSLPPSSTPLPNNSSHTPSSPTNHPFSWRAFLGKAFLTFLVLGLVLVFVPSAWIVISTRSQVHSPKNRPYAQIMDPKAATFDFIVVLGAGIENGRPSPMLQDRLDTAIDYYFELQKAAENKLGDQDGVKILMTGAKESAFYDEPQVMKTYALGRKVPEAAILMDPQGFSTYESMSRLARVYQARQPLLVTQRYHLYRSLYLGKAFGLSCQGLAADQRTYLFQIYGEAREILARDKDFFLAIWKP